MTNENRQNFSDKVIRAVGRRVSWKCSNPDCRKSTCGPGESEDVALYNGEVAHITAAAPGGPRYDPNMSKIDRTSAKNAIYLCKECAAKIDTDVSFYTVEKLHSWKQKAEERAKWEYEWGGIKRYTAKVLLPYSSSVALTQIKNVFEKHLEFFPENEQMQMKKIIHQLEQKEFPYVLLKGMPASGKSVFLYEIAKQFDEKNYNVYYYTCKEGFVPYDIIQDLDFYEKINPTGKKLYIIDDIHLSQDRVTAFFERLLNDGLNGSVFFVSRDEKSENSNYLDVSIYKRLEDVTFKLEFSPNSKKEKRHPLSIPNPLNKIKGIIQTFLKNVLGENGLKQLEYDVVLKVADKVGYDLLNLQYYLSTWEEENKKNPGIGIEMIEQKDVFKHVYDAMLNNISPLDRNVVIKYACLYQYEVSFELNINDFDVFEKIKKERQISKENQLYSFYHSKYSEMLIRSFEAYDDYFDILYKDLFDLVIINIGNYIKSYYNNRGRRYPKNMFEIFEGILSQRNNFLYDGTLKNDQVFSELINDIMIKEITFEFFYHGEIETIRIHKFINFIKTYSKETYDEICENLVYKDNYIWLKKHLMSHGDTSDFHAFVLFINDYSDFYLVFDDEDIKTLIDISGAIAIKQIYELENKEIQEHIKSLLTVEKWAEKLNDSIISQIRDVFNNIEREDKDFAIKLWSYFSDDDLIMRINESFILEITNTIPLLKKLDRNQLVRILDHYEDDFISKNINDFIKNHTEDKNMQIVSDFIQQLAEVDNDRASKLLQKIHFEDILQSLDTYNFSQIISFFTKLKEVDMVKTSELLNKIEFDFLQNKIIEIPAQNIINSIAELQRINEETAKKLFENIKEDLVRKIEKIKLETFLSYQGSMTRGQSNTIGEIVGCLSDDYIRKYKELKDMRDVTRLIELYSCVDFNVWSKEYMLNEILDYIDMNFEIKFLQKKWMLSTIQLLDSCAKVNRIIKSVGSEKSKSVFKQVLLYDENRSKFDYYVSVVEKHNIELADEIKTCYNLQILSSYKDLIDNQVGHLSESIRHDSNSGE